MHISFCAQLTSSQTLPVFTEAGTIFGTTDVYELGFSYLSISIFNCHHPHFCLIVGMALLSTLKSESTYP